MVNPRLSRMDSRLNYLNDCPILAPRLKRPSPLYSLLNRLYYRNSPVTFLISRLNRRDSRLNPHLKIDPRSNHLIPPLRTTLDQVLGKIL